MTASAPRKTVPTITIIVWIVGEGRHNNFGKRRVLEYVGVVMRSCHCGSLHAISTMFHLKRALLHACHERSVAEEYRKLRKAAARVSTVSGVETNNAKSAVSSATQNSKPNT